MANYGKFGRGAARWIFIMILGVVLYVLSCGPVLATGFWLREATGSDGFYAVFYLYYPLLAPGRHRLLHAYIDWWVNLFGTVGPG